MSRERILFVIPLVLFVGLAVYQLSLPGLHYDEAFEAVPAMQLLLGQPVTTFRGNGIPISGQLFPLMTQDYIGAINTYTAIPFFWILGINTVSLRVMSIAIGLLTLWLTYRLAYALYGPTPAVLAALLLAVNPTFIFWGRQGVFVTSATAAIGLGVALTWYCWWQTDHRRYAITGAFLLGLGLYAKLLFVWLIFGLVLAVVVLNLHQWRRISQRLMRGPIRWSLLGFLLGIAPLVVYNLQTGGTFQSIVGNLTTSYYGTNNLAFAPNLLERLKQFAGVLAGSHFWYLGRAYANWLNLALFVVALGITLWLSIGPGQDKGRRALFPFIVIGGVILASCATVSALWTTHYAVLSPWPALAVAAAADLFVRRSGLRLAARKGASLALVLTLIVISASWLADVVTDVRYHRALASSGGLGAHSDAVDDLASWLAADERHNEPVVAMDWGIAASVAFLTLGEVTPVEAFGYDWETDADFTARLEPYIGNPGSIYLWRAPDEIIFDRSGEFRRLYEPRGLDEDILGAFYERSGRPVLGATGLVPDGSALNPPQLLNGE